MIRAATGGFGCGLRDMRKLSFGSAERPTQRSINGQRFDPRQRWIERVRLGLIPEHRAGDVVLARPVAQRCQHKSITTDPPKRPLNWWCHCRSDYLRTSIAGPQPVAATLRALPSVTALVRVN